VNQHYAAYSRAVGRNFVNLFYPEAQQTTDVASYQYYIYTIQDTIDDADKLLRTYFNVRALFACVSIWPDGWSIRHTNRLVIRLGVSSS
jgi:hypothetical protein